MATFKTTSDKLKELSAGLSGEELEELKEIRQQTRTIAEIFGVFGVHDKKRWTEVKERYRKAKEAPRKKRQEDAELASLLAMPFDDKCRLFETKLPNAAGNDKRNASRLLLNHIARHKELYMPKTNYLTTVSTAKDDHVITPHSWPSCDPSDSSDAIGESADTLSKMTYDAAYSNTTQSQSETLVFDESSYNPELATPLHTCIE
ncbi:unnamed protein product [Caenorhabditis sp. 36 PRJEB53466]|nr:unnamed protein product [Caenorhabditis sp. 36 PRJEB53466]